MKMKPSCRFTDEDGDDGWDEEQEAAYQKQKQSAYEVIDTKIEKPAPLTYS